MNIQLQWLDFEGNTWPKGDQRNAMYFSSKSKQSMNLSPCVVGESQKSGSISKDDLQEQKKGDTCYLNKLFVANALPSSNAYKVCIDSQNCQLVFVRGNCVSLKHFTKDSV